MDKIAQYALEEVAFEGYQGCRLSRFWQRIECRLKTDSQSSPSTSSSSSTAGVGARRPFGFLEQDPDDGVPAFVLDDYMKAFYWKVIVDIPELQFGVDNGGKDDGGKKAVKKGKRGKKGAASAKKRKSKNVSDDDDDDNEKEVVEANATDKDATTPALPPLPQPTREMLKAKSYKEIVDIYGDRFLIRSSADHVERMLMATNTAVISKVTDTQKEFLIAIAKYRQHGVSLSDVAKIVKQEPKAAHHYVKYLIKFGFVVRYPVIAKGVSTSLCLHVNFAKQNPGYIEYIKNTQAAPGNSWMNSLQTSTSSSTAQTGSADVMLHTRFTKQKITELLQNASSHILYAEDLINTMLTNVDPKTRRAFNRQLSALEQDGYIEKLDVTKRDGKGTERALRFIKLFSALGGNTSTSTSNTVNAFDEGADDDDDDGFPRRFEEAPNPDAGIIGEGGILVDLALEYQVKRLVALSGDEGITKEKLNRSLNSIGKPLSRMMEKMGMGSDAKSSKLAQSERASKIPNDALQREILGVGDVTGVRRVLETFGKERRYRYYATNNFEDIIRSEVEMSAMSVNNAIVPPAASAGSSSRGGCDDDDLKNNAADDGNDSSDEEYHPTRTLNEKGKKGRARDDESILIIPHDDDGTGSSGEATEYHPRQHKKSQVESEPDSAEESEEEEDEEDEEDVSCFVCGKTDNEEWMLLCDNCDRGSHTFCCDPLLIDIPEGDWFCSVECEKDALKKKGVAVEENAESSKRVEREESEPAVESAPITETQPQQVTEPTPAPTPTPMTMSSSAPATTNVSSTDKANSQADPNAPTPTIISGSVVLPGAEARRMEKETNVSVTRRKRIILDIVERDKIVEGGQNFINLYYAYLRERNQDIPFQLDRKTLIRTAESLNAEKLMQVRKFTVETLTGQHKEKTLFIHRSIDKNDRRIKDALFNLSNTYTNPIKKTGSTSHRRSTNLGNIKIDSIDDILRRQMGKSADTNATEEESYDDDERSAVESGIHSAISTTPVPFGEQVVQQRSRPSVVANRGSRQQPRQQQQKQQQSQEKPSAMWGETAHRYGYISAKMLRARAFHEWLFQKITKEKELFGEDVENVSVVEGQYPNNGIFETKDVFKCFTVFQFCRLVGVTMVDKELHDYLRNPANLKTKLTDAPAAIRKKIFAKSAYKFRRVIADLLEVLVALELLTPLPSDPFETQSAEKKEYEDRYQLVRLANIYKYTQSPPRLCEAVELDGMEHVGIYWMRLEVNSRQASMEDEAEEIEGFESVDLLKTGTKPKRQAPTALPENHPLYTITNVRNWETQPPISNKNRESIEKIIQPLGLSPTDVEERAATDRPFLEDIANALHLDVDQVLNYIKFRTTKPVKSISSIKSANAAKAKRKRAESGVENEGENEIKLPKTKKSTSAAESPKGPRKRNQYHFAEEFDKDLIRAVSVFKFHNPGAKLSWNHLVAALFLGEGREESRPFREACRRRFASLVQNPDHLAEVNRLEKLYEVFFRELARMDEARDLGLVISDDKTGESDRQVPLHTTSGSEFVAECILLRSRIEWFRLQPIDAIDVEELNRGSVTRLPKDLKSLEARYNLTEGETVPSPLIEDSLSHHVSMKKRLELKVLAPYIARSSWNDQRDDYLEGMSTSQKRLMDQLCSDFVIQAMKMVVITSDANYSAKRAHDILNLFSQSLVSQAINELSSIHFLVKNKSNNIRDLPNRRLMLSDKFDHVRNGSFDPRDLKHAKAFNGFIGNVAASESVEFPEVADNGAVVAVLDKIASGELDVEPVISDEIDENIRVRENFKSTDGPKRIRKVNLSLTPSNSVAESQPASVEYSENKRIASDEGPDSASKKRGRVEEDDQQHETQVSDDTDPGWKMLCNTATGSDVEIDTMKSIYRFVREAGSIGRSIPEIKEKFSNKPDSLIAMSLKRLQAIKVQSSVDKTIRSIVCRFGFRTHRFVNHEFDYFWRVPTDISRQAISDASASKTTAADPTAKTVFTTPVPPVLQVAPPRVWIDMNGSFIESLFEDCLRTVASAILSSPGIYASRLSKKFQTMLSHCELAEVLENLESRQMVYKKCIAQPRKVSLFDNDDSDVENTDYKPIGDDSLDNGKISCYFIRPNWYSKLKTLPSSLPTRTVKGAASEAQQPAPQTVASA